MRNSIPLRKQIPAFHQIINDMEKSARAVNLRYVTDSTEGIQRKKKGKGFSYLFKNNKVTDKNIISRIKSLVIPPAWKNVWICPDENGHLQATGMDIKNRKQYRYHANWSTVRNHAKFSNLVDFGETLPQIRKKLQRDISKPELCEVKVIALVISLMEKTYIRIGNSYYEKTNGSHGITTMKDKHVQINGSEIKFSFSGKSSITHNITLKNKKLAQLIKSCKDLPGKELFQYMTEDGVRKSIDSGMVNNYLKVISEKQFTAKDFRTWAGSLNALRKILEFRAAEDATPTKKKVNEIIEYVSQKLGNTKAICKKYYIHPILLDLYSENKFPNTNSIKNKIAGLSDEENFLIGILKKYSKQDKVILNSIICADGNLMDKIK
ncbi:MAG TPA: DNA topoisomerase IB [Bacteroidia bacterium]|nr:DNA topoisomerase IB [Bacteroidia bacterium]